MSIKNLIDDSNMSLIDIINLQEFTVEDFEHIINTYPVNDSLYYNYSHKAPLRYVIKNLDKPWSFFELSKNESLTYQDFLSLRHLFEWYWSETLLNKNTNLKRSKQLYDLSKLKLKLPNELLEIIINYDDLKTISIY